VAEQRGMMKEAKSYLSETKEEKKLAAMEAARRQKNKGNKKGGKLDDNADDGQAA
jgi:hypothetical protein